jgi:predicted permease
VGTAIRQAFRSWMGAKGIALLAVVAFAVGIGSTTAIYTAVHSVLMAPLPYANGDRFVALYGARFSEPGQFSSSSFPDLQEYQRRTTSFDTFGWFTFGEFNLTAPGEPQHVSAVLATPSLVESLGAAPIVGRWFSDERGAVLSNRLWRRLGGDRAIVGQAMTLDGRTLTITGVMPPDFRLPISGPGGEGFNSDLWLYLDPLGRGSNPGFAYYFAYARRKPGVTLAQAEADVKGVAAEIAQRDPIGHPSYTARVVDLREASITGIRPTLLLLFAAAGLLLLITCANVAGLLLARSVARARETATRVALGIPQHRLALHYFAEGLIVSLAGAAAGVVASVGLVRMVIAIGADYIPHADKIAMGWTVIAFALAMAVITSILCGLAPLWQAARTAPIEVLSAGIRSSASARVRRLSQSLVVAEIALAFTLLAVSAALIGHLRNLARTSPGFDPDHMLTFSVTMPKNVESNDAARVSYQKRLTDAIAAIPGVTGAGFSSHLPLLGCCMATNIEREGHPIEARAVERTSFVTADPAFFRAMGIPLRGGRLYTEADTSEDPVHVLLNQAAATRYWGNDNPIGGFGRLSSSDGSRFQVVGIVGDVRNNGLGNATVPEIYFPSVIATTNPMMFVVRSRIPPDRLIPEVRRAVRSVDATVPIHDVATMNGIVLNSMALERVGSLMTTFFALAALLMATLGVYGIVSYGVRQRTVEIGTRMALGAAHRDVVALVLGGGLKMAGVGIVVGGAMAAGAVWLLLRYIPLPDIGWLPFAASSAIVAAVAGVASSVPAWRASLLSPMVAIRDESESVWQSARETAKRVFRDVARTVSGAGDGAAPADTTLLTEFVAAARRAESFPDAFRLALATLCDRLGAESADLLERDPAAMYRCTVSTRTDDADCVIPAAGFLLNRLRTHDAPLPLSSGEFDTLARWAAEHKPEHVVEIQTLARMGVRLAVALRTRREVLAILLLGAPAGRERYSAAERQVLRNCADQFALMIENARLTARIVEQEKLRRDLALAAEVQKRLLPERAPAADVAALAAVSLPARSVGGDYYDFIDVGDKRLGIALADVAGKGVAAALIMSVVQASLRIISTEDGISLPQLAAKMNRFLHRSTASNSYATFFYAQLDEQSRQLRYVNAGHLPPYLVRPNDGGMQELSAGGAVIGLFPHMEYQEGTVDLHPGDVLVAFTDGVTEALNLKEEEFGEERLKEAIRDVAHLPAQDISTRLAEQLRAWIKDTAQYDDLTFVVMKVN